MSGVSTDLYSAAEPRSLTRPDSAWFNVIPALGLSFMDHLWNRLDGAYPGKWRKLFPHHQAIVNWSESWVEAFDEERITLDEVKVGLRECRKRFDWPPSVSEFIQASRPMLDPLAAYQEAITGLDARGKGEIGVWSHRAVYWAAATLKGDLQLQTYGQIKERWASVLRAQFEKTEWPEIPPPRIAIPAPGLTMGSSGKSQALVADFQANGWGTQVKGDGRQWARKILAQKEAKSIAVIHAAEQALGLR